MEIVKEYDLWITEKIQYSEMHRFEYIFNWFAYFFNPPPVITYLTVILLTCEFKIFVQTLSHVIISLVITTRMKRYTARDRPKIRQNVRRLYNYRQNEKNCSMPSGDSMQAATWAMILYLYFGSALGFYIVPFVMYARIFYFCHFLSDTIIGSLLGIIQVYYINRVFALMSIFY